MCAKPYNVKKADADTSEYVQQIIPTWPGVIQERLLACQSAGYTKETLKAARSILERFQRYCVSEGVSSPIYVTRRTLRTFIAQMQASGYAPRYINAHISRIRGMYEYLIEEELMRGGDDPTYKVKFLRVGKPLIVVYSDEEVKALIDTAGKSRNKYFAARDKLMIMLMADCGMRVCEIVAMRDDWIIKDKILIEGKGNKQRLMYLTPSVLRQIKKYTRVRTAYFASKPKKINTVEGRFFKGRDGCPIRNDCVQKMLKRLAKREDCDLRPEVRNSPHTLRHWFAHKQLLNGADLMTLSRLLGHESVATTQVYLRGIADEELIESAMQTSPLNNL